MLRTILKIDRRGNQKNKQKDKKVNDDARVLTFDIDFVCQEKNVEEDLPVLKIAQRHQ